MIPELESIGFTRNEANVYSSALKLGTCSVQQLANATGLNRITVHSIVEKFERLQIFSRSYEGKRRRISPADPSRLDGLIREEEYSLRQKKESLSNILPLLNEQFLRTQRGLQVSTFKGVKGYEQICEDVLTTQTEMLEYANIDELNKVIGPYISTDYLPRKHELNVRTKFLLVDSADARTYIDSNYVHNEDAAPMQAKFIDPSVFPLHAFFVIYDDKLAILTPSNLEGVIIRDSAIADSLKPFFYFVWNNSGEAISNEDA